MRPDRQRLIRLLFDEYMELYASRDDRLTARFSENFCGYTGGDFLVKNRDEWVKIARQDSPTGRIRIEMLDLSMQDISHDVVAVTALFHIHPPVPCRIVSRETEILMLVFRLEREGWKIVQSGASIPYYLAPDAHDNRMAGRKSALNRRTFLLAGSAALCLTRPARAATVLRQPYLQNVQANRASVLWTTQEAGSGAVTAIARNGSSFIAPAIMQSFQPSDTQLPSAFYQYQADIMGLQPGTEYSYSIAVDGQNLVSDASQFRFRTAPADEFSFLALGDSGTDSPEQQALVQLMAAEPDISMVVHVGDLAYPDGTFEQFEDAYFGVDFSLMRRLPFFSTPGNHEYNTNSAAPYLAGVAAPESGVPAVDLGRYYSFDWGHAHFVSVDSNLLATSRASAMLAWLDADLAATQQHWRIVFLHHTPYPTGFHLGDPVCAAVQRLVNPIVERHGVQLLLAGHEHGYERTYPLSGGQPVSSSSPSTTYVVTGGGGGALESVGSFPQTAISVQAFHYLRVNVDGHAITLSAIGLDGGEIDQVTLGGSTQISIHSVLSKGDYTPAIAAGSLVAISGRNLARANAVSSGYPLPTTLSGVSLKLAGQSVPLLFVSSTQIEAQIPYGVSGPVTLEVTAPNGFAATALTVSAVAPSLLEIVSQNGIFSGANPARPGGEVSLYMTGLGEVQGGIESGHAAPSGSIPVISPVEVWLGHTRLDPRFAGLAQGHAGVYRVDLAIPKDLPDGVYAIRVVAGGVSSRPANVDVASRGRCDLNDRALARPECAPKADNR
jgi:acid phosphatase type 7